MRRAVAGLLVLLLAALLLASLLAGCGGNADPFTGLYWEPSSGRRVEIRKDGETYWLYYGAARQAYQAKRDGDELIIAEPMGGETIVREGDAKGTLELQTAGKTTVLRRLQQHQ
jgi:hypothetical protein